MSTIKDVAKLAGVSISTVSLAFNSPERVSESTRRKIFNAARELNYIPMRESRRTLLRKHQSESIAVISPKLVGPYFFEVLRGISETIYMNKKEMVLFSGDDAYERHCMDIIQNHEYQGVIFVHPSVKEERYMRVAVENDFPVVMCCAQREYKGVGSVLVNNEEIGKMVAEHFLKRNFERIGFLGETPHDCVERRGAFMRTLEKGGVRVPRKWEFPCELAEDAAYRTMDLFLRNNEDFPRAIFCMNDDSAIGVIEAIEHNGLRIPEDIAVVGCDDLSRSKFHVPALSTVATPKIELGMLTANMLLRRLSGISTEAITLNGKLILRDSCK